MNSLITSEDERVQSLYLQLEQAVKNLKILLHDYRPILNGERFLTDAELSERLKLSRRTLQSYRSTGKISYYQIENKILYKESDVEKLLNDNEQEAFH